MFKHTFLSIKSDYIRIYTGYRTESWMVIHSDPIYVLSWDSSNEKIKECFIDSFKKSKEIDENEEKDFNLGNDLLKRLKEKSWKSSYNALTCQLRYNGSNYNLYFTKYDSKSNSSPIVKEEKLSINTINEIDINKMISTLKSLRDT